MIQAPDVVFNEKYSTQQQQFIVKIGETGLAWVGCKAEPRSNTSVKTPWLQLCHQGHISYNNKPKQIRKVGIMLHDDCSLI